MILVDTSVLIDFFKGVPSALSKKTESFDAADTIWHCILCLSGSSAGSKIRTGIFAAQKVS